jgi:hypothetical protein
VAQGSAVNLPRKASAGCGWVGHRIKDKSDNVTAWFERLCDHTSSSQRIKPCFGRMHNLISLVYNASIRHTFPRMLAEYRSFDRVLDMQSVCYSKGSG